MGRPSCIPADSPADLIDEKNLARDAIGYKGAKWDAWFKRYRPSLLDRRLGDDYVDK